MTVRIFLAFIALWMIKAQSNQFYLFGQTEYTTKVVTDGGNIKGTVYFRGTLQNFDRLIVSQDDKICGTSRPSPRLATGINQGVSDAIIYIEGISSGKPFPTERIYLLDQRNCEYQPHVMIVPAGKNIEIVNSDAILHNVHSYETGSDPKTVFNIAQPVKGVKTSTRPLVKPGLLFATCDAGHPWMSAYIMVAPHPYYTITDKNGKFRLDNILPGMYTLHVWHEGITIVKKETEHGKVKRYEFEQPYEENKSVDVPPKSTVMADFTLTLR
jgi:plastocyanin